MQLTLREVLPVSKMLLKNVSLTLLDLSYNKLIGDAGFKKIVSSLTFNKTLKKLHLWGTNISDGSLPRLKALLKFNSGLSEINLGNNPLFSGMMSAIKCLNNKPITSPILSFVYSPKTVPLSIQEDLFYTVLSSTKYKNLLERSLRLFFLSNNFWFEIISLSFVEQEKKKNNKKILMSEYYLKQKDVIQFVIKDDSSEEEIGLDFSNRFLTKFPQKLRNFQVEWVKQLHLDNNFLTEIPNCIFQLEKLQVLCISNNRIASIDSQISKLSLLKCLDLSSNLISNFPQELCQLSNLKRLYLGNNNIANLPNEFHKLRSLKEISIYGNLLQSFPPNLYKMKNQMEIHFARNPISMCRKKIIQVWQADERFFSISGDKKLKFIPWEISLLNITHLQLNDNSLVCIPPQVGYITPLVSLDLRNNKLEDLPWQLSLLVNLNKIDLSGNPLSLIGGEVVNREANAILEFLKSHKKEDNHVRSNLCVVGENNAGKTSLIRNLKKALFAFSQSNVSPFMPDNPFQNSSESCEQIEPTKGLSIEEFEFQVASEKKKAKLLFLDFGGRDSFISTFKTLHHSNRLFFVVYDVSKGVEEGNLEFWLKTINSSFPRSPIVVIATRCDESHQYDLLPSHLESIKEMKLKKFITLVPVSHQQNVSRVKDHLLQLLGFSAAKSDEISHLKIAIKLDFKVKQLSWKVSQLNEFLLAERATREIPIIHLEELKAIFRKTFDEKEMESSLESLHKIGTIIFHKETCSSFRNFLVLDPSWLAEFYSTILEDKENLVKEGTVQTNQIQSLLHSRKYPLQLCAPLFEWMISEDLVVNILESKTTQANESKEVLKRSSALKDIRFREEDSSFLVNKSLKISSLLVPSKLPENTPEWLWSLLCEVFDPM